MFEHQRLRFAAFPYLAGRAPELDDHATLTLLGRTLARIHAVGSRGALPASARADARAARRPARDARCIESGFVPEALDEQYARVSEQVIGRVRQCFDNFGPLPALRIHGDCHAGNILWRENGPLFVDLDDCMSGPRIQDLWMFLSGDAASQQASWAALMEGYELFGEFDFAELTLVEALRSLRILHHAAWIAHPLARSGISARLSLVRRCALLGAAHRRPVRAARGHGRSAHPFEIARGAMVGLLVSAAEVFLMSGSAEYVARRVHRCACRLRAARRRAAMPPPEQTAAGQSRREPPPSRRRQKLPANMVAAVSAGKIRDRDRRALRARRVSRRSTRRCPSRSPSFRTRTSSSVRAHFESQDGLT